MQIIDRYLLRQFLKTFAICYISLAGLYIIFDAFTNLEEFMRCGKSNGGVLSLLGSFYAYQTILFFDRTAGLLVLVSTMFTISWIQRHNEMIALQAAGVSRIRIIMPLIIAALTITALATINREVVIPRCRDQLSRRPTDLLGDVGQPMQPRYDNETDVLIRGKSTFANKKRISRPNFLLPAGLREYGRQLKAKNAYYQPPQGDRPGGWLLRDISKPTGLDQRPSLALDTQPIIITPHDASEWLKPNECFVVSQMTFEQLTGGRAFRQFSSAMEMIRGLRNPNLGFGADVRVAIHTRVVNPLLDVTLLFLGLPLVVSRENRNVFVAIGTCMAVTTVFILVVIGCQQLGSSYVIDPALAAWLPLMIFVPIAVGLSESMWQ